MGGVVFFSYFRGSGCFLGSVAGPQGHNERWKTGIEGHFWAPWTHKPRNGLLRTLCGFQKVLRRPVRRFPCAGCTEPCLVPRRLRRRVRGFRTQEAQKRSPRGQGKKGMGQERCGVTFMGRESLMFGCGGLSRNRSCRCLGQTPRVLMKTRCGLDAIFHNLEGLQLPRPALKQWAGCHQTLA